MSERDPLIDPRTGDMVRGETSPGRPAMRTVTMRDGNEITYRNQTKAGQPRDRVCWISTWQEWCRASRAFVYKRGPE